MVLRDLRPLRLRGVVVATQRIFTVGHSTRSQDELLALLERAGVEAIADVRAFPSSRRHPQFNSLALGSWLPKAGIAYVHVPELGGRRRAVDGSPNGGWREPGFQGYADHMSSTEFAVGLARLIDLAVERPTATMCAEALWWQCHRRLIADALTVRGWEVIHLGTGGEASVHQLPSFAVVQDRALTYPPVQPPLFTERPRSPGREVD